MSSIKSHSCGTTDSNDNSIDRMDIDSNSPVKSNNPIAIEDNYSPPAEELPKKESLCLKRKRELDDSTQEHETPTKSGHVLKQKNTRRRLFSEDEELNKHFNEIKEEREKAKIAENEMDKLFINLSMRNDSPETGYNQGF